MKNLYNKYCDFIGVENEGYRRILIVVIILFSLRLYIFFSKVFLDSLFQIIDKHWEKNTGKHTK